MTATHEVSRVASGKHRNGTRARKRRLEHLLEEARFTLRRPLDALVDVSVCIVNWNARDVLRGCLESLYHQDQGVTLETILVDNASSDDSLSMVRREFPEVVLISNDENVGFARGNNQAAARARGRYVFFLNNDTLVPPGTLRQFVDYAEAHPEVGMIGPRLRGGDGTFQASYRGRPTVSMLLHRTALGRSLGLFRHAYRRYRRELFDPHQERQVETLMGAALFLSREVFAQCGPWDEDFPFGVEDLRFSDQIAEHHPLMFVPDIEITHLGGVSSREHSNFVAVGRALGYAHYLRKSGTGYLSLLAYKLAVTTDVPVRLVCKGLEYLHRRVRGRRDKAQKSLSALLGTWHFLRRGLVPLWRA